MMSPEAKKAINTFLPITLAGAAGLMAYNKKADWKMLLVVVGIAYVLSLVITKTATKLIQDVANRPDEVTPPPVVIGGGIPAGFNPDSWAAQLRDDVYTIFSTRDKQLYQQLAAMNSSQLVAVANSFNRNYYHEHNETIVQAMKAEAYGNDWFGTTVASDAANVIARLQALGF